MTNHTCRAAGENVGSWAGSPASTLSRRSSAVTNSVKASCLCSCSCRSATWTLSWRLLAAARQAQWGLQARLAIGISHEVLCGAYPLPGKRARTKYVFILTAMLLHNLQTRHRHLYYLACHLTAIVQLHRPQNGCPANMIPPESKASNIPYMHARHQERDPIVSAQTTPLSISTRRMHLSVTPSR